MASWLTVGTVASFEQTPRQFIDVHHFHIAVVKINHTFYAFESLCTHAAFELDEAPIEGHVITCPLHGAQFCLKSGKVLAPPAYEDLQTFPLRIEHEEVQVYV